MYIRLASLPCVSSAPEVLFTAPGRGEKGDGFSERLIRGIKKKNDGKSWLILPPENEHGKSLYQLFLLINIDKC